MLPSAHLPHQAGLGRPVVTGPVEATALGNVAGTAVAGTLLSAGGGTLLYRCAAVVAMAAMAMATTISRRFERSPR